MTTFQDLGTDVLLCGWGTEDAQPTREFISTWAEPDNEELPLRPEAGCLQRWLDLNA
jgi:hypothetical protein